MKEKKRIDPIPLIFVLLVCVGVGFLISKALKFGLKKYNEYWRNNNISYWTDLKFFGDSSIDQDEKPEDGKLRENALKLLNAHLNDETAESCGTDIVISDKYFKMLDPNYKLKKPVEQWCCLSSFLTLQKGNKAIIAFEYSIIPKDIEQAEDYCRGTFKTRKRSRLYLELKNNKWTVTDALIIL